MFLKNQSKEKIETYKGMLATIGSLSRLFSESSEPYIQYRVAENLFCNAFEAKNLSRSDCSVDASKNNLGIGIKTFLEGNGASIQKVAEFNSESDLFRNLGGKKKILKISKLRNERIDATKRIFGLKEAIYHCVARKEAGILVFESAMDYVQLDKIKNIGQNKNVISFEDGLNEYSFNITKSTLYKRFATKNVLLDFSVEILKDPLEILSTLLKKEAHTIQFAPLKKEAHIFLPLYSVKKGKKVVPPSSGLNQWNAKGRKRDFDEAYIRIPAWIHRKFSGFFPSRDTAFNLLLPNGSEMSAKVCQENSKALMSNPNSSLGRWILRDVLGLKEGELLTYAKLEQIGLDSVVIYKSENWQYDIDFTKTESYEEFLVENREEEDESEG